MFKGQCQNHFCQRVKRNVAFLKSRTSAAGKGIVVSPRRNRIWFWMGFVCLSAMAFAGSFRQPVWGLDEKQDPPVVRILPPSRQKPQPGSIRLKNGLILSGMCSRATTLAPIRSDLNPADRPDQKLEMRLVDQKAREIYLPVRRSELPTLDNTVWPTVTFAIPQKRSSRKSMPAGIPSIGPFTADGTAEGKLLRSNGKVEDLRVGIVAVNELFAEVHCLTHDWSYAIAFDAIPREHLATILSRADGFEEKPFLRLDIIRLLIRADRLLEASTLFESVKATFPELANAQGEYQQQIREQLARQITSALEDRRNAGQHELASKGARVYPKQDLTPETIVRVNQLQDFYDETDRRIKTVQMMLPALIAEVKDAELRDSATQINRLVSSQINADTIERFAAFELIASLAPEDGDKEVPEDANEEPAKDEEPANGRLSPDEQLAMAFSGWLMGVDNTVKNLGDVVSLFDAREAILDYLNTDLSESVARVSLVDRISRMEGSGIDRIAAIVRHLPSIQPPRIVLADAGASGQFTIEATSESMGATGIVPPEYHESRQYPVVIAMHGVFDSPDSYLGWWQSQAQKHGFIVIAPEWRDTSSKADASTTGGYDAAAGTHLRFLGLMRKLKLSLRLDDDRIFIAGQDLGGDVAMDMVTSHPDLFAGIISICGAGRRHLQWTAPNAIQLPWYVVVGDAQGDWFERMGTLAARFFKRDDEMDIDYDTVFIKYPSRGLERYTEECDDVFAWMQRHRRTSFHSRVYAKLLRSTDLHWSWVQVKSLPTQFAQLDAPSSPVEGMYRPSELNLRLDNNLIRIQSSPSDITLRLSPTMPGLDVNKPIRIHNGRRTTSIDYDPEISHLLEELYATGDRSRLCYMRVEVSK